MGMWWKNNQRRFDVGVKFSSKEENYVEKPPLHWIGTNLSAFLGKSIFSQILFIQKLCCSWNLEILSREIFIRWSFAAVSVVHKRKVQLQLRAHTFFHDLPVSPVGTSLHLFLWVRGVWIEYETWPAPFKPDLLLLLTAVFDTQSTIICGHESQKTTIYS